MAPKGRPTIQNRITMLQAARLRHKGVIPQNGVPIVLPDCPTVVQPAEKNISKKRSIFRRRRRGGAFQIVEELLTVRLLDDSEW